ncbi:maleylpyruvate isomerase family mycothiol-dependent enzyme [Nocardia uniformis]|uniref:Maleylpyruvate isomerase family mycothiol-dependent enzyme n=1 Tax=Nocardia uniformis TaxID=53432 RepID=A0A849CBT6_9NOCA|nr:maleylpyruvate isomerase family mycothiol-dependent enzyme [Nocardia uniformis]NNH75316.1 maleylpyruvate isomerase family mycothiol-dependent enzyme [Nocardia uniformis]
MALPFDRYCMEITNQTDQLRAVIDGADLTTAVPTCPGWNVGQLARHIGGGQRWAAAAVQRRVQEPLPDDELEFRDLSLYVNEEPVELDFWLGVGAAQLAGALAAAGEGLPLWTPVPTMPTSDFYARRFANEVVVHRADATLALGKDYAVDAEVAADAIDEWLELGSLPVMFEHHPRTRELLGPGRTLHFHATDGLPDQHADWAIDLTGDVITWRRAAEDAAVTINGPLTELLLVIYRRRPLAEANIEILGDRELFEFWLDRVSFG